MVSTHTKALKVFVSSTYVDLKEHRERVIAAARKAGLVVDPMEDWTADSNEPKVLSTHRVDGCDLCVLLVALRRGYIPVGEKRSITQMEYDRAGERGIDVLPFLLEDNAPWPHNFDELNRDLGIKAWRQELAQRHVCQFFSWDPESIKISEALLRWSLETLSRSAKSSFSTLTDFVREDAATRYKFTEVAHQIEVIDDYKRMHELLHKLSVECYRPIRDLQLDQPTDGTGEAMIEPLHRHELTLVEYLREMENLSCQPSFQKQSLSWLGELMEARQILGEVVHELVEGVEAVVVPAASPLGMGSPCDVPGSTGTPMLTDTTHRVNMDQPPGSVDWLDTKKLVNATRLIEYVLREEPSRIDFRLNEEAGKLDLEELTRQVRAGSESPDPHVRGDTQIARFAKSLHILSENLKRQVNAHSAWQVLEHKLRYIETEMKDGKVNLERVYEMWPTLRVRNRAVLDSLESDQRASFEKLSANLEAAIEIDHRTNTRLSFGDYRSFIDGKFRRVDEDLLHLCEDLRRIIGQPLNDLLEESR